MPFHNACKYAVGVSKNSAPKTTQVSTSRDGDQHQNAIAKSFPQELSVP